MPTLLRCRGAALYTAALAAAAFCGTRLHAFIHADADLIAAIRANDVSLVRTALASGADPNAVVTTGGIVGFLNRLSRRAAHTANPDDQDNPLYMRAMFRVGDGETKAAINPENVELLGLLLQYGANPDARDDLGNTPLVISAMLRNDNYMRVLLDHKADANATNFGGATALGWSILRQDETGVRMLLPHMNHKARRGQPMPAYVALAAAKSAPNIMALLIKGGFDANAADDSGETALDTAIRSGNAEQARLLRHAGALPSAELHRKVLH